MMQRSELLKAIRQVHKENFESVAIQVFRYQAMQNPLYQRFIQLLRCPIESIAHLKQIPFLPISFFKSHTLQTAQWTPQAIFTSSGTTGQVASRHLVRNLKWYQQQSLNGFQHFYGEATTYCFLALLPAYLERQGSSLVYMANHFIKQSRHPQSGFFLNDYQQLTHILATCQTHNIPTILLGVSFALWDLAEQFPQDLSRIIIMETGGMKGRRKELTREELHNILCSAFQVPTIHSEYGMTELLSQAYSKGNGRFYPTPTLRVLTRSVTDPFESLPHGKTGGINIIDLANLDTCSFIATDDLGRVYEDSSFEVLGRFDGSDIRGCNLMYV